MSNHYPAIEKDPFANIALFAQRDAIAYLRLMPDTGTFAYGSIIRDVGGWMDKCRHFWLLALSLE
jgi:hypothetical protein